MISLNIYPVVLAFPRWAIGLLTLFRLGPLLGTYSNCADPVKTLQYAASDQVLYCLFTIVSMQNTVKVKIQ